MADQHWHPDDCFTFDGVNYQLIAPAHGNAARHFCEDFANVTDWRARSATGQDIVVTTEFLNGAAGLERLDTIDLDTTVPAGSGLAAGAAARPDDTITVLISPGGRLANPHGDHSEPPAQD
jgi:hypothetical protein